MGIEPTWSAWKAEVLPLNYTRLAYIQPRTPHQSRVPVNREDAPKIVRFVSAQTTSSASIIGKS